MAEAKISSLFSKTAKATSLLTETASTDTLRNSQTVALPEGALGPDSFSPKAEGASLVDGSVLSAQMGPLGLETDISHTDTGISFYTVRQGESVASISKMFGITPATILAANSLKAGSALKAGTILTILPVSGAEYTVKKGDTIESIAIKYKADVSDITFYNNIEGNSGLKAGDTIVIPNADPNVTGHTPTPAKKEEPKNTNVSVSVTKETAPAPKSTTPSTPILNIEGLVTGTYNGKNSTPITVHPMKDYDKTDLGTAILRPISIAASRRSQGPHGWNASGVDLASPLGTPVVAAYDGTITLARDLGYNDGYGQYVIQTSVINGETVQFIYAHMSKLLVSSGQTVSRGQTIGLVGKTGDSTGYHLHFEVRGALNPLARNPNYTGE